MDVKSLTIYKCWDLNRPIIPPRSCLYQLEPVGIGTPLVESLTGYIARLAEAHCVPPGVLMERELLPFVEEVSDRIELETHPRRAGLFSRTATLNSIGMMAVNWTRAVEMMTLQSGLCFLTMLTWSEILPSRGLLSTKWAYCPACYQDWHSSGQVIYELLLWAMNGVKICPLHRRRLHFECIHCQQPLPPLAWNSRPGHCPKCNGWLGMSSDIQPAEVITQEEWQWQIWVIDAIGELIAAAPRLPSPPKRQRIAKAFSACVDELCEGNIAAFARLVNKPKNTVWMWYVGQVLPSLDVLLRVCYCLGISVLDFLTQEVLTTTQEKITNIPPPQSVRQSRKSPRPLDRNKLQQVLQAVLERGESPPPSMTDVAKTLGYDVRFLRKHFSVLCSAISARYLSYQRECYEKRVEQLCCEVCRIAVELDAQGVYPSNTRVSSYLTQPGCIRNKDVRLVLCEVRRQLGWET